MCIFTGILFAANAEKFMISMFTEPVENGLNGFTVTRKDVYYSGICPDCNNKSKN